MKRFRQFGCWSALLGLTLSIAAVPVPAAAQYVGQGQDQGQSDQPQSPQDDPPSRVARLGYMEGSVSFEPAGEQDWVQAVANRPMTTGDKLWADKDSRAELQLGSAVIRLDANTGFSFLNLDDNTAQIQLTAGAIHLRVRRLNDNEIYEIDTPNLAFTVSQPGSYRIEASEDGTYSVISIREGGGEATGNGQTYTLHAGQRGTFDGTDSLNAEVTDIGGRDPFDNWSADRDRRYDDSRSAQYVSPDVVGFEDLDSFGDWRDDSNYGHVWYPNRVDAGWAPYHEGHWDWIAPWGYTWVDDSPWGYAPFHYGRWVAVGGRWGWVAGPIAVRPVYAPALVVFIGGGIGVGFGGNVGWFPLGPREVYVPSYRVSPGYVNRVNISNTTVTTTQITNVYNTTIINNKTTNITNITYANRNVRGAVTAVPQRAFASAQPVARAAVAVNAQQIASASLSARVAVAPTRDSVLGARAATANHVSAPPAAVLSRTVVAKRTPPPPPVSFAKQQAALEAHPGQPLARSEMRSLRPAPAEAPRPMVRQAPPGRPATATVGRPGSQPGAPPNSARPGQPGASPSANQPGDRPGNSPRPNDRPAANRPPVAQPIPAQPVNRPDASRPAQTPGGSDRTPANRPPADRPTADRPPSERSLPTQPSPRPEAVRPATPPENARPNPPNARPSQPDRPAQAPVRNERPANPPNDRPQAPRPEPNRAPQASRPETPPPSDRPSRTPPAETRPAPQREQPRPPTAEEKKHQEEERQKRESKPPGI